MNFFKKNNRWPSPKFNENDQPHFLFIITPPNSGSTALSELLNTSHRTMILQPEGEGQWLVPGLCEKNRWSPDKEVNYLSVKSTWLSTYQQVNRLTQNIDVAIEKSPPNMMRIHQLSSQFRDYSFIANNRDPYANCASILYRYRDAENLSPDKRKKILNNSAKKWIMRSAKIKELMSSLNAPLLTYEEFCRNPSSVIKILNLPNGVSESINPDANVRVKDYKSQCISNQNERQISNLTDEEIEHISASLKLNNQLLEFFSYQLLR
ncbi:MAG: sulfotransferase family protein [Methylococcales symbiont of Hymedesmia sp. n. MRB-2018]|nr:MAG: sulfotransferase family protein [Methylococcales symbiont of Hymedesmia sp. n. MRB-2018]